MGKKPKSKEQSYISWDAGDSNGMLKAYGQLQYNTEPIVRTQASNLYGDILPNISVKDGFDRRDYEAFRPEEAIPKRQQEMIAAAMRAYSSVGIVHNVIDLMGDFACQGIKVTHANERIEKFYQEWFRKVKGPERSERFLNYLYRCGIVLPKRSTAKLGVKDEEQLKSVRGSPDVTIEKEIPLEKREIPWRYTFLNPLALEVQGEELAQFLGGDTYVYAIRIPDPLARKIKAPKNAVDKMLVGKIPTDIVASIREGNRLVPLDPNKVTAYYYKKDDWSVWPAPMIASVLADLNLLQKMKLADLAALDGAISNIRVWKLGDLKERLLPTPATIQRLAEMLNNNVGGGVMDLIWGPELNLQETSTEVYKFLGQTKYEPVLASIYAGLGIPPTLTGAATSSGFTNNYISLKTLVERLEYGRQILRSFWENEIRLVQRAMGFRFPATLTFSRINLSDESAQGALLVQLLDRSGISMESLQEIFGLTPDVEEVRVRREERRRKNGQLPPRTSAIPSEEHDLIKVFTNLGMTTPSQVGIELDDKDTGEKTFVEMQAKTQKDIAKNKPAPTIAAPPGVAGQGRPKNTKDTQKRKTKQVKPRTGKTRASQFLDNFVVAENMQSEIDKLIRPSYLKSIGKKNLRELTEAETKTFESFKLAVLCKFDFGQQITKANLKEIMSTPTKMPKEVKDLLEASVSKFITSNNKQPPLEVLRRFQAGIYAMYKGQYEEEETSDNDNNLSQIS